MRSLWQLWIWLKVRGRAPCRFLSCDLCVVPARWPPGIFCFLNVFRPRFSGLQASATFQAHVFCFRWSRLSSRVLSWLLHTLPSRSTAALLRFWNCKEHTLKICCPRNETPWNEIKGQGTNSLRLLDNYCQTAFWKCCVTLPNHKHWVVLFCSLLVWWHRWPLLIS